MLKKVRIKDLGKIITGNTPPTTTRAFYGDFRPFIKATDITDSKYTLSTEEGYSEFAYEKYKKNLVPKGATCVVTIGTVGKKITMAHTELFVNQAINAVIPYSKYDADYVYYLLKYNLSQLKMLDSGTASGRENISKSSFSNIIVFAEEERILQQKIGQMLSNYDLAIENNNKRIKKLEQMVENLYKEWFVRFRFPNHEGTTIENGIPLGWKLYKISEICDINKSSLRKTDCIDVINYLDTGSLNENIINGLEEYQIYDAPSRAKRKAKKNSILFSTVRPILKHYGIIKKVPNNMIVSTGFAVLDAKYDISNIIYLFVSSDEVRSYCQTIAEGAVATYPTIRPEEIGRIKIALPPLEEAERLNKLLEPYFLMRQRLVDINTNLINQRDLLLPRLMSGKLEV
ncbi:MAG: restriction endonuclease subunit S [Lachnospiraceae bacterium]|nr:restriction endonuclease subunit S [Lachnospiraceae bacterium]